MRGPNLYLDGKKVQITTHHTDNSTSSTTAKKETPKKSSDYKPEYVFPYWYYNRPRPRPKPKPKPKPKEKPKPQQPKKPIIIPFRFRYRFMPDERIKPENTSQPVPKPPQKKPKKKQNKQRVLDVTLSQLEHGAKVPSNYGFSYPSQGQKFDFSKYALSPSKSQELTNIIGVPVAKVKIPESTTISEDEAKKKFQEVASQYGGTITSITQEGNEWVATLNTPQGQVNVKLPTKIVLDAQTALQELKKQGYNVSGVKKEGNTYVGYVKGLPSQKVAFLSPTPSLPPMPEEALDSDTTALNPGLHKKLTDEWYKQINQMEEEEIKNGDFLANLDAGMEAYNPIFNLAQLAGLEKGTPTVSYSESGNKLAYALGAGVGIAGDSLTAEVLGAGTAILGSRAAVAGGRGLEILRNSQRLEKVANALSKASNGIRYVTRPLGKIPGARRFYYAIQREARELGKEAAKALPYLKRAGNWAFNTKPGQLTTLGIMELPADIKRYEEGMSPGDIILHTTRDFSTGLGFMHGFESAFPKTDLALNRMKVNIGRRYGRHYVPWQKIEHPDGTVEYVLTKYREGIQPLAEGGNLRSIFANKYIERNIPTPAGMKSLGREETISFTKYYPGNGEAILAPPGEYRLAVPPKTSPVKNSWAFFGRGPLDDIATNFRITPKPEIWQYKATPVSENIWKELSEINRYARMGRTPFSLRFKPASISESEFYTTVSEPIHTTTIRELSRSSVDSARPFYERLDKMAEEMSKFRIENPEEAYYRLLRSPYYKEASPVKAGFKVSKPSWTFEKNIPTPATKLPKNIWAERRAYLMARRPFSLDYEPATGFWQERTVNSIAPGANGGKVSLLEIPEQNTVLRTGTTPLKWAEENVAEFPRNFEIWTKYGPEGPGKPMMREAGAIRRFAAPDHQRGWSVEFRKGDVAFIKGRKFRYPGEQYDFFVKTGNRDFNNPYTIDDETTILDRVRGKFNDAIDYTKSRLRNLRNIMKRSQGVTTTAKGATKTAEDFDEMNRLLEKWNGKKPIKPKTGEEVGEVGGKPNTSSNGLTTVQKTEQEALQDIIQKGTTQDVGMKVLRNAYKYFPVEELTPGIILPTPLYTLLEGEVVPVAETKPGVSTGVTTGTVVTVQPQTTVQTEKEKEKVGWDYRPFLWIPVPKPDFGDEDEGTKGMFRQIPNPRGADHNTPVPPITLPDIIEEPPSTKPKPQGQVTVQKAPPQNIPQAPVELPMEVSTVPPVPPDVPPIDFGVPPIPFSLPFGGGDGGGAPFGWASSGEFGFWVGVTPFLGGSGGGTGKAMSPEEQIYMEYVEWLVKQGFNPKLAMKIAAEILTSRKVTPALIEQILRRAPGTIPNVELKRQSKMAAPKLKNMSMMRERGSLLV